MDGGLRAGWWARAGGGARDAAWYVPGHAAGNGRRTERGDGPNRLDDRHAGGDDGRGEERRS